MIAGVLADGFSMGSQKGFFSGCPLYMLPLFGLYGGTASFAFPVFLSGNPGGLLYDKRVRLSYSICLKGKRKISQFFESLQIRQYPWGTEEVSVKFPTVGWAGLFLLFFLLYSWIGFQFMKTGSFSKVDVFFGADVRWMIGDVSEFFANHYRTNTHPLGVLLVNSIGSLFWTSSTNMR